MKESQQIRKEMEIDTSDNDYRDFNYLRKIERAERAESFCEDILPEIKENYNVLSECSTKYVIDTGKWGIVDYYPKSGSLLFHRRGNWIKRYGLRWIKNYLIK